MKTQDEAMKEADEARARVEELAKKVGELKEELNQASADNDGLIGENRRLAAELEKARQDPLLKVFVEMVDERVKYWQEKVGGNGGATLDAGERVVKVKSPEREVEFTVDDVQGRLLKLAAEGHFDSWRALGETKDALEAHKWVEADSTVRSGLKALSDKGLLSTRKSEKWGNQYAKPDLVRFVEAS